jgi:hypothetical protein
MKEKTERFEVHLGASILKALDEWRRRQSNLPSRGVAIRLLVHVRTAHRHRVSDLEGYRFNSRRLKIIARRAKKSEFISFL